MADSEPAQRPQTASPAPGHPIKGGHDLTSGPITRTLIAFALPTLGANMLQSLNGSVNAIWVGRILGESALAATSNANLVMFLMFAAIFGFGIAATILVGQSVGRGDIDSARRVVGSAAGLFLLLSIVISVIGYVETPGLLRLLATPPEVLPLALAYLRVIFLSMPAGFMVALLGMSLRGVGDSVTPLIWMVVSVVIDVGMNPVLMLGLGPFPAMGIAGSAAATAFASYVTVIGLLVHIYWRDKAIRLRGAELRYLIPDFALVRLIIAKGVPMMVQMFVMSFSALVMIGIINREGMVTTAAYGVTSTLWTYISMPAMAVGTAVSAMVAQNIGADRWDRVAKITRSGIIFSLSVTTSMVLLLALVDRYALGLFLAADSPALPIARHIQLLSTWSFIMFGVTFTLFGTIRANGVVWPAVIILFTSAVPLRIGIALLFHPMLGADAIWLSFPASSLVTMLLAIAYYRYGNWRTARITMPVHEEHAEGLQTPL
ncbi:MAG: MATE family efflux transporter [Sphingomonadales bacterium]